MYAIWTHLQYIKQKYDFFFTIFKILHFKILCLRIVVHFFIMKIYCTKKNLPITFQGQFRKLF